MSFCWCLGAQLPAKSPSVSVSSQGGKATVDGKGSGGSMSSLFNEIQKGVKLNPSSSRKQGAGKVKVCQSSKY